MTKIEILRQKAGALYLKGQILESYKIYKKMLKHTHYSKRVKLKDKLNDLQGMSSMTNYLGMNKESLEYAKKIYNLNPNDYDSLITLSSKYLFMKQYFESIKYALEAKKLNNTFIVYDILAEAYMNIKDFELARESGIISLHLKEILAKQYISDISNNCVIHSLDKNDKRKNIISFSLFGNSPKYCENAIINAKISSEIYPYWTCRFYCADDVPKNIDYLQAA